MLGDGWQLASGKISRQMSNNKLAGVHLGHCNKVL